MMLLRRTLECTTLQTTVCCLSWSAVKSCNTYSYHRTKPAQHCSFRICRAVSTGKDTLALASPSSPSVLRPLYCIPNMVQCRKLVKFHGCFLCSASEGER